MLHPPSRRPHDPATRAWQGENWQLVEPEQRTASRGVEVGVLWGRGTLDERVEHAGSLVLALETLARELRRPGAVRAEVQIGSDVCGLRLRGELEGVRAAWAGLPDLFTSTLDTTGLTPGHVSKLPWLEDVLLRTGPSGAALQLFRFETEGTQDAARRLLRELDPRRGDVPCVFWTDQESLVGAAFAVGPLRGAGLGRRWAEGTPRWRRDPEAWPQGGNRASVVPIPERGHEVLSMMVPRTADGIVAAELVRSCLVRTLDRTLDGTLALERSEPVDITSRMTGMGEGLHVVLSFRTFLAPERRPDLFTALLQDLDDLPGSAVEEAIADSISSARCEREQRVHGLSPAMEPTAQGVHEALVAAQRSLHICLDPALLSLREHARLSALPVVGPVEEDPSAPAETYRGSMRSAMLGNGDTSTRARLSLTTLHVSGSGMVNDVSPRAELPDTATVDLTRVIAVWDQPPDAVWLLAHTGELIRVSSSALVGRKAFTRDLDAALHGVPRVTQRGWSHRRDFSGLPGALFGCLLVLSPGLLFFGFVGVMIHHQNSGPAWIERSPSWTETVELTNGTDITVHQPVPATSPSSAGGEGEFIVDVTVCGGIDSLGKTPAGETAEREVQNTVQSSDYALRGEGGTELTPVITEEQPPVLLEPKECTSLELHYRGELGDQPALVYTNAVGDEVNWS